MVASVTYVLRLLANVLRSVLLPFWLYGRWSWARAGARGARRWIELRLSPRIVPFRASEPWLRRLLVRAREQRSTSLTELRDLVRAVSGDDRVVGLAVHIPSLESGWSACEGVREAFQQLRAAGKRVVCYLPEGGGNRELYIALAADRIYLAPYSGFGPLGLAAHPLYVRPLLDRLGIAVEAQAAGEYKSAAEPVLRDSMSEPAREQLQAMLSGTHAALFDALRDRGLSPEQIASVFERALLTDKDAIAAGVVDGAIYEDEFHAQLDGGAEGSKPLAAAEFVCRHQRRLFQALRRPPRIAVIPLHGTISAGQGGRFGGAALRPAPLSKLLRRLAADPSVRAAVLHIDSPGGSALASELMHREISCFAQKKPTVACFGEVAASGGYFVACACQKIIAQPLAVTGSIGVISAKLDAVGLLDRLGVKPQQLRTARSADMLSYTRRLSSEEDALLRAHANDIYERFLNVVAHGRGRSVADVEPLARGRVWIAREARERGLVDELGGLDRALSEVRSLVADLTPAAREALEPQIYSLRAPGAGLSGLRGALLEWLFAPMSAWTAELAALDVMRRESAVYYAPFVSPFE
jgi:protease-4